jgi:hypothetical protein
MSGNRSQYQKRMDLHISLSAHLLLNWAEISHTHPFKYVNYIIDGAGSDLPHHPLVQWHRSPSSLGWMQSLFHN